MATLHARELPTVRTPAAMVAVAVDAPLPTAVNTLAAARDLTLIAVVATKRPFAAGVTARSSILLIDADAVGPSLLRVGVAKGGLPGTYRHKTNGRVQNIEKARGYSRIFDVRYRAEKAMRVVDGRGTDRNKNTLDSVNELLGDDAPLSGV